MKGSWMWASLALAACGGKDVGTHVDSTATTDGDTDTDADTDSDTDADTDSGSSGDSGTTPVSTDPVDGRWRGHCSPTAEGPIVDFAFDVQLNDSGGNVTGSGTMQVEGDLGGTTTTVTLPPPPPWSTYYTGSGYGGSGGPWTPPGGSGGGWTSYGTTVTTVTVTVITGTVPTGPGGGTVYQVPVTVRGTWDGTSELDTVIDVGSPANPHLDGSVASGVWTATLTDPSGYLDPFDCSLTRQ